MAYNTYMPLKRNLTALLLFFAVTAFYLFTAPPSVTTGDSGEFITGACTLGISHPPGYPLFSIIGKAFSTLPLANPAYRVALVSVMCGALAVSLLFVALHMLTGSFVAALLAAVLYAVNPTVWSQSIIAEVYALNALCTVACLSVLLLWRKTGETRFLSLFFLLFGIGLANHYPLMLLASPAFAVLIGPGVKRLPARAYLLFPALAAAGFLLYGYLLIRSRIDPVLDWGNPDSLGSLLTHVLRQQYKTTEFGGTAGVLDKALFARDFLVSILRHYSLFVIALAAGIRASYRQDRKLFWSLLLLFTANSFGLILLLAFSYNPERLSIVTVYYLPSYLALSLWVGMGIQFIEEQLKGRVAAVRTVLIVTCCLLGVSSFRANDQRGNLLAYDYGRMILSQLPRDATLFIEEAGDESLFTALYLHEVEGKRRDVNVYDCFGNVFKNIYGEGFTLVNEKSEWYRRRRAVENSVIARAAGPVYYLVFSPNDAVVDLPMTREGLFYRVGGSAALPSFWERTALRRVDHKRHDEYQEREIAGVYYYLRGLDDRQQSPLFFRAALLRAYDVNWIINNIGLEYYRGGLYHEAAAAFMNTLSLYPDYFSAWYNLGLVRREQGALREAAESFEKALLLNPFDRETMLEIVDINWMLGSTARAGELLAAQLKGRATGEYYFFSGARSYRKKELRQAIGEWEKAVIASPDYALCYYNLGIAYRDAGNVRGAKKAFEDFLRLEPGSELAGAVRDALATLQ